MHIRHSKYFDRKDMDILRLVNRVLEGRAQTQEVFVDPHLHPHGIKELIDSPVARMAYAVVNLLRNLEGGRVQSRDRLLGLRILYDEVINSAHTSLCRNTARVLMQIMKDIVRAHGDEERQLKLAHDFRAAAQGTPRIVRRLLKRYRLPEMSEEWNQLAFDNHVYDMNTKGRKSPTHLIMDAWIKGLRNVTIIYDNCVDSEIAQEVLDASAIVDITVRIGLEFKVPFRGKFVSFLWSPRGFASDLDFLNFLQSPKMQALAARGREVVAYKRDIVLRTLDVWNNTLRPGYAKDLGVEIPPLAVDDYLNYVGRGHANKERLAEFLFTVLQPLFVARLNDLMARKVSLGEEELRQKRMLLDICSDTIQDEWLNEELHPELPRIVLPDDLDGLPPLLALKPIELMRTLQDVNAGYRMVLNSSCLTVEDVMELLWDCKGMISHLEIFSMRGWVGGGMTSISEIGELQKALNSGQGPRLKQMIRQMILKMQEQGDEERAAKFEKILANVPTLWDRYKNLPLKTRLGTASSNRTRAFGMGLVVTDTLPRRSARFLAEENMGQPAIPVHAEVEQRVIYREPDNPSVWDAFLSLFRGLPGCSRLGMVKRREWALASDTMRICKNGNIVNLSGTSDYRPCAAEGEEVHSPGIHYLNSTLCNVLKVLLGFIPALGSFLYTQDWWFLAWFGSFIWFGITGVRNVIQMVLAAQGLSRRSLMHWREHVSVSRICDSLMYTGISVFLLEVMVYVWFLKGFIGVDTGSNPLFCLTVISMVNGAYICAHNIYRGFPRTAAIGNIFRSFLNIPVAALYNAGFWHLLMFMGVQDPNYYLIPSATIISKTASDTVAAVIEGFADSRVNRRMRITDYQAKLRLVFDCYTKLELMFPQEDALNSLAHAGGLQGRGGAEAVKLERAFIVNALDMMYLWYYQPRAQDAFRHVLRTLTSADKTVLARSQLVLLREREVAQLMVDGLIGLDFARPLAFFLRKRKEYVKEIVALCKGARPRAAGRSRTVIGENGAA